MEECAAPRCTLALHTREFDRRTTSISTGRDAASTRAVLCYCWRSGLAVWLPSEGDACTSMGSSDGSSSSRITTSGWPGFNITLYNVLDAEYYAHIHVGSPPQLLRAAFATASADLAALAIQRDGHVFFNHSKSSTYQADGRKVTVGDGASGVLARDRFVLDERVAVDAQHFAEVTHISNVFFNDSHFDVWFGLAPRSTQSIYEVPTILHSLFASRIVEKTVVGVWMPQGRDGFVSFGEITSDASNSEMKYVAQSLSGLWTYSINKIDVGGTPINVPMARGDGSSSVAVLDTAFTSVVGPPAAVEAIANALGASKWSRLTWTVPCAQLIPAITFWNGEHSITLTAKELVGRRVDETNCFFKLRTWGSRESPLGDWAFGLPVFHRYFFAFFYDESPRLGYALLPQ